MSRGRGRPAKVKPKRRGALSCLSIRRYAAQLQKAAREERREAYQSQRVAGLSAEAPLLVRVPRVPHEVSHSKAVCAGRDVDVVELGFVFGKSCTHIM